MKNTCAIVTGAASGIGRATAIAFARRGCSVIVSDRDLEGGEETVRMIGSEGGTARFVGCDIAHADHVRAMVEQAIEHFGRLDFACNNAGVEGEQAPTADCPEESWDRVIDINLRGTWLCMKHEIPPMLAGGRGAIVNVSSIAGLVGFPDIASYVASKHGINGLTKAAALEYARQNIRVNAVCPGAIVTPMIDRFTHGSPESAAALTERHPMGRMGRPEEIAATIVWLCSDDASFVTGQTIAVDGGYVAQ